VANAFFRDQTGAIIAPSGNFKGAADVIDGKFLADHRSRDHVPTRQGHQAGFVEAIGIGSRLWPAGRISLLGALGGSTAQRLLAEPASNLEQNSHGQHPSSN
jgi:hypothetical protein